MYYVTTVAFFLFGFSLPFTAVKLLFVLPNWLVRFALYTAVLAFYAAGIFGAREANFGWFHCIWSVVAMVLIFGLLRQQSAHVCRWLLYIVTSILVSLMLFVVAAILHKATDVWLHQVYINRRETPIPALILLGFPVGLSVGQLFAWVGTRKDQATGHAKAKHWSWWSIPWNVALFVTLVISMIVNDWMMCVERDAIIARIEDLTVEIDALAPRPHATTSPMLQRIEYAYHVAPTIDPWIENAREDLDWLSAVNDGLELLDSVVASGGYQGLQKLSTNRIVQIAELCVTRSMYRLNVDDLDGAIEDISRATDLIDYGIAEDGWGSDELGGFESNRKEAIVYLINKCDSSHLSQLAKLITKVPHVHLKSPPSVSYVTERTKLSSGSMAIRSFASNSWDPITQNGTMSFWWRFFGLRHANSAARSELSFALSAPPSNNSARDFGQTPRLIANAAIRGALVSLKHGRTPTRVELFANDFTSEESNNYAYMTRDGSWFLWRMQQPNDEALAPTLSADDLFRFFSQRSVVISGPYHRARHLEAAKRAVANARRSEFLDLVRHQSPNSAFVALEPAVAERLLETFEKAVADPSYDQRAQIEFQRVLRDPKSTVLDLSDKWIELGFCITENPFDSTGCINFLMMYPITSFNTVNSATSTERRQAAAVLLNLTEDSLRSRYESIPSDLKDYLLRPIYTFDGVKSAFAQLRDFYKNAESHDLTVLFCPNPPTAISEDSPVADGTRE